MLANTRNRTPWLAYALLAGVLVFLGSFLTVPQSADAATAYASLPDAPASVLSAGADTSMGSATDWAAWESEMAGSGAVDAFAGSALQLGATGVLAAGAAVGYGIGTAGMTVYYQLQGNSSQQIASKLCAGGLANKIVDIVDTGHVSCTLSNGLTAAQENADVIAGYNSPTVGTTTCDVSGNCAKWVGLGTVTSTEVGLNSSATSGTPEFCGSSPVGVPTLWVETAAGKTYAIASTSSGTGSSASSFLSSVGCSVIPTPSTTEGIRIIPSTLQGSTVTGVATTSSPSSWTSIGVSANSADPQRDMVNTVTGTNGVQYSCTTSTFYETDPTIPDICAPAVPSGVIPSLDTLTLHTPDGSAPDQTLSTESTTTAYQDFSTAEPDCATGACSYQVMQKTAAGWEPCTVGTDTACADWFTDPQKSADFECVDGPSSNPTEYTDALADCTELSDYYDAQSQSEGQAYTNPSTGAATGADTSPDQDAQQMNEPGQDLNADGSNADCFPSGWGAFNPLNWVLQPGQCLFRWAFIPTQTDISEFEDQVSSAWDTSAPGEIVDVAIPAYVLPSFDDSGCQGPQLSISINFWQSFGGLLAFMDSVPALAYTGYPLSACDAPLSTWAALSRTFSSLVLIWFGGFAIMRQIGGVVGSRGIGGEA